MRREDLVTGSAQPGDREPAAGDLRLVQDFVNTVDRENVVELFDGVDGLGEWLAHRGLDVAAGPAELRRAVELREALRTVLLEHAEPGTAPGLAAARRVLATAGRRARLAPEFDPVALLPAAGGVDGALGRVVAVAFAAMLDGRWTRLKACPRDVCGWVFYDRSTANAGTWCSMRVCGQRVKANAYYRRRTRT